MRTMEFNNEVYNVSRNEKPIYRNFASSKLSNSVKPNTMVEFTDFMGRKHLVQCRNNSELKKQMKFFAELKKESLTISQIISSYPMSMGKVEKKFISEVRRELKGTLNLSKKQIDLILG
jgi:hypothetical protein